ncbi:MAG: PAS domain-containing protein, partial [Planctomycetota bacterium]
MVDVGVRMLRGWKPTSSVSLTLLALTLVVLLWAWCLSLIVSSETLRGQVATNVGRLLAVDAVQGGVDYLNDLFVARVVEAEPQEPQIKWSDLYRENAWRLSELRAGVSDEDLLDLLDQVDAAFVEMNDVAGPLLATDAAKVSAGVDSARFLSAHRSALDSIADARRLIRAQQTELSARLATKWRELYALAVLAAATTVVVLLLLLRERRSAEAQQLVEQSLRESEARLGSVLMAVPDVILVIDAEGRYRDVFTADPKLLAQPVEQLLGRSFHEILPPEVAAPIQEIVDGVLRTGERQQYEYQLATAGEDRWFSASVVPFGEAEDPCVMWVARDVTKRKLAEEAHRESEARFRQLTENLDQVIWLSTWPDREVFYVNRAYEQIWGRSRQSLYDDPQSWQGAIHPEDRERVRRAFQHDIERGVYDEEFRLVREDKSVCWIRDRAFPIRDGEGKVYRLAGCSEDITERKLAEERLRDSEEQFRSVVSMASDAVIVADDGGLIQVWNDAAERMFGYPAAEAVGQPLTIIIPQRDHRAHEEGVRNFAAEGTEHRLMDRTVELTARRRDNLEFPVEMSLTNRVTSRGLVFSAIVRDITERRRNEDALRDSEERFRSAFERTAVGMALVKPDGCFIRANESFGSMLGYDEDELVGKSYRDITHPDDLEPSQEAVRGVVVGANDAFTLEKRYIRRNGDVLWAITSVGAVRDRQGKLVYLVAESQDITERKKVEGTLRQSEGIFRQLTENIREVFWITSGDGEQIVYVSPAYEEVWGRSCQSLYDDASQWLEAIVEEDRSRVERAFIQADSGGDFDEEYRIRRPDGSLRWIRDQGAPILDEDGRVDRIAGIAEDITELAERREHLETVVEERTAELRESHARLRVADRLALIGTLAAGLGHDMNNVLFS